MCMWSCRSPGCYFRAPKRRDCWKSLFYAWLTAGPWLSMTSCAYSLPRSIRSLRVSSPLRGAKSTPASRPIVKYLIAVRSPLNIALLQTPYYSYRAPGLGTHDEAHDKAKYDATQQGRYE